MQLVLVMALRQRLRSTLQHSNRTPFVDGLSHTLVRQRYYVAKYFHNLCTRCTASFSPYTRFVLKVLRHPILKQLVNARYCVIRSLHKLCTLGIASSNPYTSCVHKVLRHPVLTQVVCARYCVIQSLHKLCAQGIASSNPYTSCVR